MGRRAPVHHLDGGKYMNQTLCLNELLTRVKSEKIAVASHSGKVTSGGIFVVLPAAVPERLIATTPGGEQYLSQAAALNPAYIVIEERLVQLAQSLAPHVTIVPCSCSRDALGQLAAAYYDTDTQCPAILGITGTNGKTTETYLLEHIFKAQGQATGILGTVEYRWPGYHKASDLTTPGCLELHALFANMAQAGTTLACMEVSSHAIDQKRVAGLNFSGALITNLTQDHLDYHADLQEYFDTKAKLFRPLTQNGLPYENKIGAVNADDRWCRQLLKENKQLIGYGITESSVGGTRHLFGEILGMTPQGIHLKMRYEGREWELRSPLVGGFNAMNLLGVQALGLAYGMDEGAFACLESFNGVPGRMERVANGKHLNIFVDYAHTPDALEKAQLALHEAGFNRLITLFGCGGNRDKTKRPLMGQAVAKHAHVAVLTSDNPRKEDPEAIMQDVLPGLAQCKEVHCQADRRLALAEAIAMLGPKDALLVAGKGHEPYQIIGETKHPFSDQQIIQELAR